MSRTFWVPARTLILIGTIHTNLLLSYLYDTCMFFLLTKHAFKVTIITIVSKQIRPHDYNLILKLLIISK